MLRSHITSPLFVLAVAAIYCSSLLGATISLLSKANPPSSTARGLFTGNNGRMSSSDGRYVVYGSTAITLVDGVTDNNSTYDVFLYDRVLDTTKLVSHSAGIPLQAANGRSDPMQISPDGRFITYRSRATDLVAGITYNSAPINVFLYDVQGDITSLVSHMTNSLTTAIGGDGGVMSDDASFVLFQESATGALWLYDRSTGGLSLVSHSAVSSTTPASGNIGGFTLSGDGRYVVFTSDAQDLINGFSNPANVQFNTYFFDRATGNNTLISHSSSSSTTSANGFAIFNNISNDGRYVCITSSATDLVAGITDTNGTYDCYLYDRQTDAFTLVAHTPSSATTTVNMYSTGNVSNDGNFVVWTSPTTDLLSTKFSTTSNVFLYDRSNGSNTLVSHALGSTDIGGDADSSFAAMTSDAHYILFQSTGTNFLNGLNAGTIRIFRYDRTTGNTVVEPIVSQFSASTVSNISDDGNIVLFSSSATDLVPNDFNHAQDYFTYDVQANAISVVTKPSPSQISVSAFANSIIGIKPVNALSADGKYSVFASTDTNLVPGVTDQNGQDDLYLCDNATGVVTLISHSAASFTTVANGRSANPSISADGNYVTFISNATDLVSGQTDTNSQYDLFIWERATNTTMMITHALGAPTTASDNGFGGYSTMDATAEFVVYDSPSTNLVANDTNGANDIFIYDRASNTSTALTSGDKDSFYGLITSDGRYILFYSTATNIVAGQVSNNAGGDMFLFDRINNTITLLSHAAGSPLATGNGIVDDFGISDDGNYIIFTTYATDMIAGITDNNALRDVYIIDRVANTIKLVSASTSSPTTTSNGDSYVPYISNAGNRATFLSTATDLVSGQSDTNTFADVFVYDRNSGAVSLASGQSNSKIVSGNDACLEPFISPDGEFVVFRSKSTDLVPGQVATPGFTHVFLHQCVTGRTWLVDHIQGSSVAPDLSSGLRAELTTNGSTVYVIFNSSSVNLVPGDFNRNPNNPGTDTFLYKNSPTTVPIDNDSAPNSIPEFTSNATPVGFTAFSSDPEGDTVTYSLQDNAGGRFAIDPVTGVVTVADSSLFNFEASPSYDIIVQASDGFLSSMATVTINIINVNEAPAISSQPTAVPNPAGTGQSITFNVAGTDVDANDVLTYAWDFGDGSNGVGASVLHSYAQPGNYSVTVTVSDLGALTATSNTILITVVAPTLGTGNDSDGDGFSDAYETNAGTSPTDPNDTPLNGAAASSATIQPLLIAKFGIKLKLVSGPNDAIAFSGTVPVPDNFAVQNQKVVVDVGGVGKAFTLDSKGASTPKGNDSFKIFVKAKKGVVLAQTSKFMAKFNKGDFDAQLNDDGLTNTDEKNKNISVPVSLIFNNVIYGKIQPQLYSAKTDKSGKTTMPK